MLSSNILVKRIEVGSLMTKENKLYEEQRDTAVQMLKIFQKLSYEDKLRVIGITEGLLISQNGSNLSVNARNK